LHLVREISLMRTVFNMPMLLPIDSPLLSLLSEVRRPSNPATAWVDAVDFRPREIRLYQR
jgi:hypothetical protein